MALNRALLKFNRLFDKKDVLAIPIEQIIEPFSKLEPRCNNTYIAISGCPFCGVQKFYIYKESNRFYCHNCKKKGDGINFIMQFKRLNFKTAIRFMAEMFL